MRVSLGKAMLRCAIFVCILGLILSILPAPSHAFSPQVIQRGAVGDDVIELQARLQYIGYYKGKIDGVFGWGTYWSVRNFQNDFGIEVDGYVGDELKQKLEKVTRYDRAYVFGELEKGKTPETYGDQKGPQGEVPPPGQRDPGTKPGGQAGQPGGGGHAAPGGDQGAQPNGGDQAGEQAETPVGEYEEGVNIPDGFTDNDLRLIANAVYGEARGEPYEGQVAVAAVILNRVNDERFPNTISGVIFEPRAFTAVSDGQIWLDPNDTAERAVQDAINGWDPTNGLVYYFNPATATSQWMFEREQVKRIGKHVFVKGMGD
ncbi:spore cortex-lytic enzyme [Caldalkalibacillus salinus]|uniref:spore cortex-lytic enzyme n=1 Tax=Caldalkalibacillus salinus TaxID=2803787 RepID=UPI0019244521|nr:spore cortex-lytic enzyme [Caldalkalibacillus salinus]